MLEKTENCQSKFAYVLLLCEDILHVIVKLSVILYLAQYRYNIFELVQSRKKMKKTIN